MLLSVGAYRCAANQDVCLIFVILLYINCQGRIVDAFVVGGETIQGSLSILIDRVRVACHLKRAWVKCRTNNSISWMKRQYRFALIVTAHTLSSGHQKSFKTPKSKPTCAKTCRILKDSTSQEDSKPRSLRARLPSKTQAHAGRASFLAYSSFIRRGSNPKVMPTAARP